ncbi:hypothetical protein Taro_053036 [Colocasia esculenta]|uniref:Uncharacterized protein n=1 Tax=Colocasia esculenta TaxID=4460 RepID=A0A843XLE0_COLES|nr:hypothetical protein [Colocasia esculenta]
MELLQRFYSGFRLQMARAAQEPHEDDARSVGFSSSYPTDSLTVDRAGCIPSSTRAPAFVYFGDFATPPCTFFITSALWPIGLLCSDPYRPPLGKAD